MLPYDRLTDEELIDRIRGGDTLAEEFLYGKYRKIIRAKSRSYFLVGADYDDLVQEGMIGLYNAVREYTSVRNVSFHAYADLCITRQILTAIKNATRKKHSPLNSYISFSQPISDGNETEKTLADILESSSSEDPEKALLGRETLEMLSYDMQHLLSPLERKTLTLYLRGLSYQQIGDEIGRSRKCVDNTIQRIKKKLEPRYKS
ncbi:MAG: RNA polymerase sporulation sigma factor SigH [Clostridiales bacterium]|nr:RNA polymerase sporulation sigma factor SigH [Clostridiales bacterium]